MKKHEIVSWVLRFCYVALCAFIWVKPRATERDLMNFGVLTGLTIMTPYLAGLLWTIGVNDSIKYLNNKNWIMTQSKIASLNWNDALKGFVVAFLTASLTGLIQTLESGSLPNLAAVKVHVVAGLIAGLSYIIKQFLTNTNGDLLKKEVTQDAAPQDDDGVGAPPRDRNKP